MPAPDPALLAHMQAAVLAQIDRDEIVLPALPNAVVKALTLLRSPDFELDALLRVLESDPVISAQIIRLANSAAFGSREPSRTLTLALTRLGVARLRSFLVEHSARKVFASRDAAINQACRKLWEHSVGAALVARDVAAVALKGRDEAVESAYLGGLLHDIGKPILAGQLLDAEHRLRGRRTRGWLTPDQWIEIVATTHRRVGVTLVHRWELPAIVEETVRSAYILDFGDPPSVTNAVVFANALVKRAGLYVGPVDASQNDVLVSEGAALLGLDDVTVSQLARDLGARVRERLT